MPPKILTRIPSTFLSDRCELGTKVKIFLIPNKLFKLPDDQKKPIIMEHLKMK